MRMAAIGGDASELERVSSSNSGSSTATTASARVQPSSELVLAVSAASSSSASTTSATTAAPLSLSSGVGVVEALDFELMDERKVLSLWDFGGQSEYFAVHDLFLTRGAVYVLVVDWTKGVAKARESAQRWMDAIWAHVGDSAFVLPVLPRCGAASVGNGTLDEVARMLAELVGCAPVRVDSATDDNYGELKRELLALADVQTSASGKVVLRWLRVHDELCRLRAEKKKQWITRAELRTLLQSLLGMDAAAVNDDDMQRVVEYLKRSGTVLTCGGERVSEYVFLDPKLFMDVVRPLINTKEQIDKRKADALKNAALAAAQRPLDSDYEHLTENCVASRALLEHVWRAVESPVQDNIGFFVELLEHCGLMCELEKDKFFVPAASKATPSTGLTLDWTAGAEQIALVCTDEKVKALPPSLLPRVVASLFKGGAIDKPNRQRIVTQSDVVLLLRDDSGTEQRRVRLQQTGNRFVMTLQSGEAAEARAWRLRAYTTLYAAVESVLRLVFGSLTVKASVLCATCSDWRAGTICSVCDAELASIKAWLPSDGDALKPQRSDWAIVAPWTITVTAPVMRVIYFSASPLHKTPAKKQIDWPKLDWKAEFDEVKTKTTAITNPRVSLQFEFCDEGTRKKLKEVLEANDATPTILVIACHGDPKGAPPGALQFCDRVDRTIAHATDAAKLTSVLQRTRHQLVLTVFCSCHSMLLAPAIQRVAQVPAFVTFGADSISVEHTTLFLTELLVDLVRSPIGTHMSQAVVRATREVLATADVSGDIGLAAFASKILWSTATHTESANAGAKAEAVQRAATSTAPAKTTAKETKE